MFLSQFVKAFSWRCLGLPIKFLKSFFSHLNLMNIKLKPWPQDEKDLIISKFLKNAPNYRNTHQGDKAKWLSVFFTFLHSQHMSRQSQYKSFKRLHVCIHSDGFIEHLLCTRHSSRFWRYSNAKSDKIICVLKPYTLEI